MKIELRSLKNKSRIESTKFKIYFLMIKFFKFNKQNNSPNSQHNPNLKSINYKDR
jgi:hypothetical protein